MSEPRGRRLPWILWAAAMVLAALAGVLFWLSRSVPSPNQFGFRGFTLIFALSFSTVGAVVASRRPENRVGWLMLATGVLSSVQELSSQYAMFIAAHPTSLPYVPALAWLTSWIWVPATTLISVFLFLLFPDGHALSPRWRIVGWMAVVGDLLFVAGLAFFPGPLDNAPTLNNPFGTGFGKTLQASAGTAGSVVYLGAMLGALASLVIRLHRAEGDERQQLKWFASAAGVIVALLASTFFQQGSATGGAIGSLSVAVVVAFGMVPVVAGIAILKYRLYDIDVVINRAFVYGVLGVFITLDYVAVVVGVGALVGRRGSPVLTAVAAALAALTFLPLRRRLQRIANRMVYGKRATPYEVLSAFSERVAESYSADDVLPRMARVLGEGTGAARAEVWLRVGGQMRLSAVWPPDDASAGEGGADLAVAVRHQGEELGRLTVRKRPGERLTPPEEKLLADLASQAGLVLRNAKLLEELRASRMRLVSAQDAERRRLERDIHDGAQQQLVALAVKLRLAETLVERDATKAKQLIGQVKAETTDALETLRDLARGIYPPLLADQGLAAALEAHARKGPVPVVVHPDGVGRYGQDTEAAVYFCVLEALQNVAKYANASGVDLTLRQNDATLEFEVRDDGRGFDPATTPKGSGLQNMADRLEALGGSVEIRSAPGQGTTVAGRVPAGT